MILRNRQCQYHSSGKILQNSFALLWLRSAIHGVSPPSIFHNCRSRCHFSRMLWDQLARMQPEVSSLLGRSVFFLSSVACAMFIFIAYRYAFAMHLKSTKRFSHRCGARIQRIAPWLVAPCFFHVVGAFCVAYNSAPRQHFTPL